ncbi:MAG TPA: DNA repair protein RecN [Steroidobacteraceae bacterium]|jgi:DNA repair protein RecN (Recombination protein N)|nr:DNA repair protein RecN [Steroidobacteraceae bacterium]
MLTHLKLRDLVIVDEAELELGAGLLALTGETGAGKSIVVDALMLIAGGRGAGDIVRHGAERAEVAAGFSRLSAGALAWLDAQSVEHEGEVIVRRVIGADGRSRAYINGQLVPLQSLRELSEFLIEIHGQQEYQHLLKRGAQRELLDERLPKRALPAEVAEIYERLRACRLEHGALRTAAENRDARLDLLRYQWTELKSEVTTGAAIEELFAEQRRIAGRGRLAAAASSALAAVYENDHASAHDLLAKAATALRSAADTDPTLKPSADLIGEAAILAREAAEALRHYLEALDVDPARQEEIERKAAALEALARKHRMSVTDLPGQLERTEQEIGRLAEAETRLTAMEQQELELELEFEAAAERLTQARTLAAATLGSEITALMQELGMGGGRFEVSVTPGTDGFGAHGRDEIEFLVSANPGQPPKSLAKVASGGELSRISLAVQVAAAARNAASLCMVFDEVDSGIGGAVAEIVGRQLRALGERGQVLCVTHLAQVAAQAHGQFRVTKLTDGKATRTAVKPLSAPERVDEIARMSGGIDITDQARAHARDMLARAASAESSPKTKTRTRRPAIAGRSAT